MVLFALLSSSQGLRIKRLGAKHRALSFSDLLKTNLLETGAVRAGAILSQSGVSYANSPNLIITPVEIQKFKNVYSSQKIPATGLPISGTPHAVLSVSPTTITTKYGQLGAVLVKTKLLIIVGIFEFPQQPKVANEAVTKLANYFSSQGQ